MKMLIPSLLALLPFTAPAQTQTLATGLSHPESVISDGHYLYVSDIGAAMDPMAKDGDGAISKLSLQGKLISKNISRAPLNAPKGSAIIKGVLYVADIDRLVGIDLQSGELRTEIDLSSQQTKFLNDVAAKDGNTVFVSASDIGKLFEVKVDGSRTVNAVPVQELPMLNGLCYDAAAQILYVCSMTGEKGPGQAGLISWKDGQPAYARIGNASGIFDGIALVNRQTLALSDWTSFDKPAGVIKLLNVHSGKATQLALPVIAGAADFYYDPAGKRLLIPVMLEGKIISHQLK